MSDTSAIDRPSSERAATHEDEPLLRDQPPDPLIKPTSRLVLYFMAIHFLLAFAEIILVAPLLRLFENSLCLSHYGFPDGGIEEPLCKIQEVQRPLATIRGWKSTFDTIPGRTRRCGRDI